MSQFGHCGVKPQAAALRVVRVAAAVQEQHRLLAALEPLGQGLAQRPRQQRVAGALAPQVHDPHRRQRPRVHARRQPQQPVLAPRGVGQRLEAGGGRAQHDRDAEQLGAAHGDVAPVVAQHLALLVGGLVLLVHDDELEVRQRREHRRARAHHHVERAAAGQLPVAPPLAHRQVRVEQADPRREAPAERRHDLGAQRHLGHQHQRLPARLARGVGGAQVDLGLAARRHAVQQQRGEAAARHRRGHRAHRLGLPAGEPHALGQRQRHHRLLDRGAAGPAAREALQAAGQRRRQRLAGRGEVVVGDPAGQFEQVRRERRPRQHAGDLAHACPLAGRRRGVRRRRGRCGRGTAP